MKHVCMYACMYVFMYVYIMRGRVNVLESISSAASSPLVSMDFDDVDVVGDLKASISSPYIHTYMHTLYSFIYTTR
jgi:hypothetical protein